MPVLHSLLSRLGKGAHGIVWQAKEKRSGNVVALKKCFDAFRNGTDAQRTYRSDQMSHMGRGRGVVRVWVRSRVWVRACVMGVAALDETREVWLRVGWRGCGNIYTRVSSKAIAGVW